MQYAVPKHYLWAIGEGIKACRPGELIAGRYLFKGDRILLDTQSEQFPEMPEDIPGFITPYLRLFPHRLHVPEVYGLIPRTVTKLGSDIWLLENGPLSTTGEGLMPELAIAWKNGTAMRQLSWLWQIAQLWQPCSSQAVASTLLNPQLLRVEGPLVRLLELQSDQKAPNLSQLGQLWQQWAGSAHPAIASFLRQLCQQMTAGQLRTPEQLISQLDKALALCGRSLDRTIHIATGTDTGPTRSHNEDACYPPNGTAIKVSPGSEACAIVCDGIGGQDGGEVASELAVTTLRDRVQQMLLHPANCDPQSLIGKLERSACAANDAISGRNDSEHRQLRQRMGTTVVMALAHAHELYISHVGDSRAYWITRDSCRQVTLDDDVACREVRLGYALYRDALQQVAAGALVQALGITSSASLHPTVQRFPLDEDCIFLLCSDGLSDKDRIEECWETEILPILNGANNVAKVKDRLIEIANTRNGHDNVTIALIYCQVKPKEEGSTLTELSIAPLDVTTYFTEEENDAAPNFSIHNAGGNSSLKTQFFPRPKTQSPLPYLLGILLLLGLGGLPLAYFFNQDFSEAANGWFKGILPEKPVIDPVTSSPASPVPTNAVSSFKPGDLIEVKANSGAKSDPLILNTEFGKSEVKGILPVGSILQVINTESNEQDTWLEVKICSLPGNGNSSQIKLNSPKSLAKIPKQPIRSSPSVASPSASPSIKANLEPETSKLTPGETGWIKEEESTFKIDPNLEPNLLQKCSS
ncbi:protein phosphatase 2C domain-containing protein [Kamptonema sp. UHCC 0994]|uniref:PP2C family protein-serine/threonine phosphatase n=1 Tax=Kamptonema sp. UHCC 0994 TaxID=3031329 RepID=UPI0023B93628|nr:protein phosphatase 2C domain-containing protein [Kamptonema sp. UHCC 0994]MDF0552279.1 protein phosphatase 2C domain-containing protein [Kamptonema sp. UHCC 0994]